MQELYTIAVVSFVYREGLQTCSVLLYRMCFICDYTKIMLSPCSSFSTAHIPDASAALDWTCCTWL